MPCCVAINCKSRDNRTESGDYISFHRFPTDRKLRKTWEHRVSRKNWSVDRRSQKATVLCGLHFEPDQFVINPVTAQSIGYCVSSCRLKPGAVPTIFNYGAKQEIDVDLERQPTAPKKRRYCERRDREELIQQMLFEYETAAGEPETEVEEEQEEAVEAKPVEEPQTAVKEEQEAAVEATSVEEPQTAVKEEQEEAVEATPVEEPQTAVKEEQDAAVEAIQVEEPETAVKEEQEAVVEATPVEEPETAVEEEQEAVVEATPVEEPETAVKEEQDAAAEATPVEEPQTAVEEEQEAAVEATPMEEPETAVKEEQEAAVEATPVEEPQTVVKEEQESAVEATPMEEPQTTVEEPAEISDKAEKKDNKIGCKPLVRHRAIQTACSVKLKNKCTQTDSASFLESSPCPTPNPLIDPMLSSPPKSFSLAAGKSPSPLLQQSSKICKCRCACNLSASPEKVPYITRSGRKTRIKVV